VGLPVNPCGRRVHVNCRLFQAKANKSWLSSPVGILENAAVRSVAAKRVARCGVCERTAEGSGAAGRGTVTWWLIALESWTNPNSDSPSLPALLFLPGNTRVLCGDSRIVETPRGVCFGVLPPSSRGRVTAEGAPPLGFTDLGREGPYKCLKNIFRVGVKRMGPDSFQWCPATGPGATGTN